MIDKRVGKTGRVVAKGAIAAGVLVHRRIGLPSGAETSKTGAAIVARLTIVSDTRVVKIRRDERGGRMAKRAILARRQMACRLNDVRIDREELTHMATFTATTNVQMQRDKERCRGKRTGGVMADTAIILSRDVINLLGRRYTGVMASRAIVGVYTQVIEGDTGEARVVVDDMTGRAIQRCRQMIRRLAETDLAVMASRAVVDIDTHVIERHAGEVRGVMAHGAIFAGRQVIDELANGDHIVVARLTVIDHIEMIVGARGKGTRRVTNTTVLDGGHVVDRFTARRHAMTGSAVVDDGGVIDNCVGETRGVMAGPTVLDSGQVNGHCGRLAGRIDTVGVVMARLTGLHGGVNAVIEDTTETEGGDAMTGHTIDEGSRMAAGLTGRGDSMAGIAAVIRHFRPRVVGVSP